MIDFFGQSQFYLSDKEACDEIFNSVLSGETLLRGKSVELLENKLCSYVGRKYSVAVNSGTDAMIIALKSIGVGQGDEIIVPSFSFIATATPVKLVGATPVFVDVNKKNGMIDIEKIESKITSKTKALIVVDLFGECPDYSKLIKLCKKNNIFLVEDGAQSFGSKYKSVPAGNFGIVSTISFDVSKVIFGVSTGGAILTNNYKVYKNAQKLRGHGFNPEKRNFELLGYNSNMSSLNAAMILHRIDLMEDYSLKREYVKKYYDESFKNSRNITLLNRGKYSKGNNHKYVIFVNNRDGLIKHLKSCNIPVKVHYDKPIPNYKCISYGKGSFFGAKYLSSNILSLPIHPFLNDEELEYIVKCVKGFYE